MDCFRYESAGLWDCRNCCSSCHEDFWDFGEPAVEADIAPNRWEMVCCSLAEVVDTESLPEEFWR